MYVSRSYAAATGLDGTYYKLVLPFPALLSGWQAFRLTRRVVAPLRYSTWTFLRQDSSVVRSSASPTYYNRYAYYALRGCLPFPSWNYALLVLHCICLYFNITCPHLLALRMSHFSSIPFHNGTLGVFSHCLDGADSFAHYFSYGTDGLPERCGFYSGALPLATTIAAASIPLLASVFACVPLLVFLAVPVSGFFRGSVSLDHGLRTAGLWTFNISVGNRRLPSALAVQRLLNEGRRCR